MFRQFKVFTFLTLLSGLSFLAQGAQAEPGPTLVESTDDIGFTLDEDWREWWRRITDRGGRDDPNGSIQQRFPEAQYPTHQMDLATADYPMGDEQEWAGRENGARFWVHSYSAVELGTNVQIKSGRALSEQLRFDIRYDRLYTRNTESDLVQAEFTWAPGKKTTPYITLGVFPRIEKHDTDVSLTVGYRHKDFGDARLRIWALDAFATLSYSVAVGRGSPLDLLWKQTSVPLGIAAELASVRIGGVRTELYVGTVVPQTKNLYTEELTYVRKQEEWATMFGGMVEWQLPKLPLWLGATAMLVDSHWGREDLNQPELDETINEHTYQGRLYALSVPRKDMRLEAYLRLMQRPEETYTPEGFTVHEDKELFGLMRWQWLLSKYLGFELSYMGYNRTTEGPPKLKVDGAGHRVVTRLLWHMKKMNMTLGTGWNPASNVLYDGSGLTVSVDMD